MYMPRPPDKTMSGVSLATRPRFLADVVAIESDAGILMDGLGKIEVLRGPLAQTVLPQLLMLMDGSRTVEQLEATFPDLPQEYIGLAISKLHSWGLLGSEEADTAAGSVHQALMAFLRRQIAAMGLHDSASAALSRLREKTLTIIVPNGAEKWADALAAACQDMAFASLKTVGDASFSSGLGPGEFVVLLPGATEPDWSRNFQGNAAGTGVCWLRTSLSSEGAHADIGPVFSPTNGSCYDCFAHTHVSAAGDTRTLEMADPSLFASFLALEILYSIGLPSLSFGPRQLRRFSTSSWESGLLSYPRLPGCANCRPKEFGPFNPPALRSSFRVTDTALVFEDYVGIDSRSGLGTGLKTAFISAVERHEVDAANFPNAEHVPLYRGPITLQGDALDVMLRDPQRRECPSIEKLAALLSLTGGIRETSEHGVRRWSANAGNLGSVKLFVAARDVTGLDAGVYYYEARMHSLARLHGYANFNVDAFMRTALGRDTQHLPSALLFCVGSFSALSQKYGPFGYRLLHFDAGCAVSQLQLAAHGLCLNARTTATPCDEVVTERLRLQEEEFLTAMVELSNDTRRNSNNSATCCHSMEVPVSWKSAAAFSGLDLSAVTDMLFKESRHAVVAKPFRRESGKSWSAFLSSSKGAIKLPQVQNQGRSIEEVLRSRRSVRTFSETPVELRAISTALSCAVLSDSGLWPQSYLHSALDFLVLANRVKGLAPGVYRYDSRARSLRLHRSLLTDAQKLELFVQPEFSKAAAVIWITGNLEQACAARGARGHRELLLRAGAAGHRLWMAGVAQGASGTVIAGLVPGAARRILGLDGYESASLFASAWGYPVQSESHNDLPVSSEVDQ
jgi:SagB-type dehydrogenase family enzyme